jgi:hypothetical protein
MLLLLLLPLLPPLTPFPPSAKGGRRTIMPKGIEVTVILPVALIANVKALHDRGANHRAVH